MRALTWITIAPVLATVPCLAPAGDEAGDVKSLLEKITSAETDVRYAARAEAPRIGAPAVLPLAALIDEGRGAKTSDGAPDRQRREVALTARAALERIVHHAGRKGADTERKAVASELARALDAARTPKEKRELLHLTAFIGGDPEAAAVARLLDDEDGHVRETARLALERIPGASALAALTEAARKAGEDRKPDLVFSIGKKGDAAASGFLVETARSGSQKTRLAAFAALSRLGAADAAAAFEGALAQPDLPERALIVNEYLRWADERLASSPGSAEEAKKAYLAVLASAPLEHQRERAVLRLSLEPFESIDALLASIADPGERVRRAALRRLLEMKGTAPRDALFRAYKEGKPESRPAILRALFEKDSEAARPLVREAATGSDRELKITALDIEDALGDASMESAYLEVAQAGSPSVRPVALKGYLALARKRLESGEKEAAFAMYGRALEAASGPARSEALKGLLAAGEAKAIDRVAGLLKDPGIGAEASRAYVDLAAKVGASGDKEKAEKLLLEIVRGEFARDLKAKAVEELKTLGRDPQALIRAQGFVVDWWVLGSMEDRDGKGLERKFFPEEGIDLGKEHSIGPRRFRWRTPESISLDGTIQLAPLFRRSENTIAYAFAEIDSSAAQEVSFRIGSDDGIACWLNGERILFKNEQRNLKIDEDTVPAKLAAGPNKVLLKIRNTDGDWCFAFRITDAKGSPLDLPVSSRASSRRP